MKLKPLEPKFGAKLIHKLSKNISKEFRYNIIAEKAKDNIDSIIVLGNGNVDDLVVPIVCHHLDGNRVVGISKPDGKKRLNALNELPVYISGHKIEKIALVMDQEGDDLADIFMQAQSKLRDLNIGFETDKKENRFTQYKCKYGRTFFI